MTSLDPSEHWYRSFFTLDFNEFWRRAVPPEITAAEAAFVRRSLGVPPPARLLDVPCGSGRHAVRLADAGYRVTGIDLSADAIAHAKATGSAAEFHCRDMTELPADEPFDGALCLGNSFGYLTDAGMALFVAALARVLKPGARLVLDTAMVAEAIFATWQDGREHALGDIHVASNSDYDCVRGRVRTSYRLTRGGVTTEQRVSHRVYTVRELAALLGEHGLAVEALHGGTDGAPFAIGAPRLWLVAQRE